MTDTLATTALKILDDLQLKESRLLSWGMVDGAFTNDEIEGIAERVIESLGVDIDPDDALEWLEDRALLFNLPAPEEDRYRTRVAEGVRLFARLRQIFSNRSWSDAKELVADFRFVTLPRRYPDRYIDPGDAVMQLKRDLDCSALQTEVAFQLLGGENSGWKLADFQVEATARILAEAKTDHASATIVCAGTGSGKTLAFYLPAFMHIAERLEDDPRTQCLAIYPRNELLRDQLKTAILNARMVDAGAHFQSGPSTVQYLTMRATWTNRGIESPGPTCTAKDGELGAVHTSIARSATHHWVGSRMTSWKKGSSWSAQAVSSS
jgi:hypothetical protein